MFTMWFSSVGLIVLITLWARYCEDSELRVLQTITFLLLNLDSLKRRKKYESRLKEYDYGLTVKSGSSRRGRERAVAESLAYQTAVVFNRNE
jgi:hypothetical protein